MQRPGQGTDMCRVEYREYTGMDNMLVRMLVPPAPPWRALGVAARSERFSRLVWLHRPTTHIRGN